MARSVKSAANGAAEASSALLRRTWRRSEAVHRYGAAEKKAARLATRSVYGRFLRTGAAGRSGVPLRLGQSAPPRLAASHKGRATFFGVLSASSVGVRSFINVL